MPDIPRDDSSPPFSRFYRRTLDLPHPDDTENFLIDIPQGGRVLDLACGTGRFAAAFRRDRADLTVDALEQSREGCELARQHAGIHVLERPMQSLSVESQYDAIWANNALFMKGVELADMLARIHTALKPGGKLDFTYIADEPDGKHHAFGFDARTQAQLTDALTAAGFHIDYFIQREDRPYGQSRTLLPSFHIIAYKPPYDPA